MADNCYIVYKGKNYTQEDFLDYLKSLLPSQSYSWSRKSENGYEVSSKGDKRFSALVAKLKDGRTIEEAYQLDIKGYRSQGNDWRLGKGKPPIRQISKEQSWEEYKDLWRTYLNENPDLEQDLREKAKGKVLTDMFASTDVSQARALAELLNEGKISTTSNNPSEFVNHSGGAYGGDTMWDQIGREFGVTNHKHYKDAGNASLSQQLRNKGVKAEILTKEQMDFARQKVKELLGVEYKDDLRGNLQVRNFYQVYNADAVYAIATPDDKPNDYTSVKGGTNTAIQLAIKLGKPVYLWSTISQKWYKYEVLQSGLAGFVQTETPVLTKNFAGIGTRNIENYNTLQDGQWKPRKEYLGDKISKAAQQAIRDVYEKTFNQSEQGLNSPTSINTIKEGVTEVFKNTPELASIGTQEQYSQYLDTIFPDSKVKDIVYHITDVPNIDKFKTKDLNKKHYTKLYEGTERVLDGAFFTDDITAARTLYNTGFKEVIETEYDEYGEATPVYKDIKNEQFEYATLINVNNPYIGERKNTNNETVKNYDSAILETIEKVEYLPGNEMEVKYTEYVVFEPEQIHILGSKQDIEGFKNFIENLENNDLGKQAIRDVYKKTFGNSTSIQYSDFGTKTASKNVKIDPINGRKPTSNKNEIVAYRGPNTASMKNEEGLIKDLEENRMIGNPFGPYGLVKINDTEQAVMAFYNWLNGTAYQDKFQNYKQAILDKANEMKGLDIIYYKDLGQPSHATALDYFLNNQPQSVEQSNLIEPGDHFNFENSRTLLQSVVDHPNVESYVKDLAQQLLDKVDIDSINLNTHIPNANTLGKFRLLENQVDINLAVFIKREINTVERIAEAIVHEYIHAATVQGLKDFKKGLNDNVHLKNINQLFIDYRNSVKDNPEFQEFLNLLERNRNGEEFVGKELEKIKKLQDKYYAAYRVEEFVTMGLSNPTTREILKNRNLLQQLFDSIKEFLGLDNNVYKLLKKEYNAYLDSQTNIKTEIKPYKYYGANYEIKVENGVGVDVIGYKGSITNKNKLLQEFNKNPNIDPQTGKSFQAGTEKKKESPVTESKYELFPGVYANEGQKRAIDSIEEFFAGDKDQFLLKGRGGTGKTTIVKKTLEQFDKSRVKILGSTISYEAKNVLQDNMQGYKTATLASVLGLIPDYAKDGSMFFREKTLEERMNSSGVIAPLPIETVDILIVDEASMIDEFIYNKLLELKKPRTKILFMGDNVQIPPINSRTDEEGNVIKGENSDSPVWQLIDSGDYVELSERMRQGAESPILPITDLYAKNVEEIQSGETGLKNPLTNRTSNFQNNEGVLFTSDVNEVVNQFVEDIEGSTDIREAVIVGARNAVVDDMNLRVREKLFETKEPFVIGDSIRINSPHVENNEVIFENGLRAKVKDVHELPEDNLGLKRYELEIEYIETNEKGDKFIRKAFLKTISPQDQKQYKNKLREMAARAKSFVPKTPESKKAWKEFFDIKNSTVDVGYGYAITSHKVQGSTYNSAYVLEGDIMSFPGGIEQTNRMMYTAVSRPRKKLVIFNPSVVESQQVSQPKVDIRAKVYELFNLQGYIDIKTSHKTDKNLIIAISHYVLEDLGYKTDQEKLQAVREGFKLSEYITTEQISDVHTRVRLNMKNIIEDEVDDGPISLGGIKFTSSGYESDAKNAFTNNLSNFIKFENPYDNTINKNYKEDNSVKIEVLDTLELGTKHFEKMSEIRNLINDIQDIENANKVDIYHSYHGTNKVNIDSNGNLILKPSLNFEGKTNSISFTQVPAVAEDYAMRKQGEYIIQINNSQIKNKYTIENTEEIAVNTEKELVIPRGQYKILKANTAISNQNKDIRNRVQKYYDYDNVGYAIVDAFEQQQYYEELLDMEEQAFNNPVSRQPKWYKNDNQRNRDAATIFLKEKKRELGEDRFNKLLKTSPSREIRQHIENEEKLLKSLNIGNKVMFRTPSGKLEKVTVTNIDYNTNFISVNINGKIEEIDANSIIDIIDNSNFAEDAFTCK